MKTLYLLKGLLVLLACLAATPAYSQCNVNENFSSATFPPDNGVSGAWRRFKGNSSTCVNTNQRWTNLGGGASASAQVFGYTCGSDRTVMAEDWLLMPRVRPVAGADTLRFESARTFANAPLYSRYAIRVSTTASAPPANDASGSTVNTFAASFTTIATYAEQSWSQIPNPTGIFDNTMRSFKVPLTAYIGQDIYVAFVLIQNGDNGWKLDNVTGVPFATPPAACAANPSMSVFANNNEIGQNSISYSTANNTEFGPSAGLTAINYTYTIRNTGNDTLRLTGNPIVAIDTISAFSTDFQVTQQPAAKIAPGGSSNFVIRFLPRSGTVAARAVTVKITNNDPNRQPRFSFNVRGTAAPVLTLRWAANRAIIANNDTIPGLTDGTDFGNFFQGDAATGITRTFRLVNSGIGSFLLNNGFSNPVEVRPARIEIAGDTSFFRITQQPALRTNPGDSTSFVVRFLPPASSISYGLKQVHIRFTSDDPAVPTFIYRVQGRYLANVPVMVVAGNRVVIQDGDTSPSVADSTIIGTAALNAPISVRYRIRSTGRQALVIPEGGVTLSGDHASDFSIQSLSSSNIAAGDSATLVIRFSPRGLGLRNATVSITSNDASTSPYTFAIAATGRVPVATVRGNRRDIANGDDTPEAGDWTELGTFNAGVNVERTFFIHNTGNEPLVLSGNPIVSLTGSADFSLTQPTRNTIAAGDSVGFNVRYQTNQTGNRTGTISLATNAPNAATYTFSVRGLTGPLGLPEDLSRGSLSVFPNPTMHKLTVSLSGIQIAEWSWQITDLSGRALLDGQTSQPQVELSLDKLSKGVYFLLIQAGKERVQRRIVLE